MTLLTTEIVTHPRSAIVFAADRRISLNGRRFAERPKILRIPLKQAGIGYFGLAQMPLNGRRRHMDIWLSEFLAERAALPTLRKLAHALARELNRVIPAGTRQAHVSGFHLAGFDNGRPEFWFIRNVADDRVTVVGRYSAREEFQRRDRTRLQSGAIQIYRNGDIRAHTAAWNGIDSSFGALLALPDFGIRAGPIAHMRWVKFKMETVAHFYQRFCNTSIIGKPIDAFVITPTAVLLPL